VALDSRDAWIPESETILRDLDTRPREHLQSLFADTQDPICRLLNNLSLNCSQFRIEWELYHVHHLTG
jgi:hypothetical protein